MAFLNDVFKNIGDFFGGNKSTTNSSPTKTNTSQFSGTSNPFAAPQKANPTPQSQTDEDDEEKRRRQAAAAALAAKQQAAFDARKLATPDPTQAPAKAQSQDDEINSIYQSKLQAAKDNVNKGTGFFDRVFNQGQLDKTAEANARTQAISEYQNRHGYDNSNQGVADYETKTNQNIADNSAQIQKNIQTTNNVQKGMTKAAAVVDKIPVVGSVLGLESAGLEGIANLTGDKEDAGTLSNLRAQTQLGMSNEDIAKLDPATQQKLRVLQGVSTGAMPLDFLGLGAVVKSGITTTAGKVIKDAILEKATKGAVSAETKQAALQLAKTTGKTAAIGTGAGAGISAAGQEYLTGKVDPLQTANDALTGGGLGVLLGDARVPKPSLGRTLEKATDGLSTVESTASGEAARIPGQVGSSAQSGIPDPTKVEIAPGIKVSTPQGDTNRGNLQTPTDPNNGFNIGQSQASDATAQPAPAISANPTTQAADADTSVPFLDRAPTTVGQAQLALEKGGTPAPDSAFDADARLNAGQALGTDAGDANLDVPTYLRKNAAAKAEEAQNTLDTTDLALAHLEAAEAAPNTSAFNDKQQIAQAFRESPQKGRAVAAYIENRNQRQAADTSKQQLIASRQQAQADLEAAQRAAAANAADAAPAPTIPDPTAGRVLAKSDVPAVAEAAPEVAPAAPAPIFTPPVKAAPTTTDVAEAANAGLPADPANLRSDAQVAQDLEAAGVAPQRGDSPTQVAGAAEEAARTETAANQASGQGDAPRAREQFAARIEDPTLQDEVRTNFPDGNKINIAEEQAKARTAIGSMSDEQLVDAFKNGVAVDTPQRFYQAVYLADRLGRSEVIANNPEAARIAQNAVEAVVARTSEGGRILRTTQILFENMPPALKTATLLKSLGKAGEDMTDGDRSLFTRLIERSDEADQGVSQLQDEATSIISELKNNPGGADVPALKQRFAELSQQYDEAKTNAATTTAAAVKFYDQFKEKGPALSKLADTGRGLMLSGIGGRVFDNLSTASTALNDVATSSVSGIIGKAVNKVAGRGAAVSTIMNPAALTKGLKEGVKEIGDSFRGKGREDLSLKAFAGNAENRSGVGDSNKFNRFVNNIVDIPTKLTKGIETAKIEQLAKQEASQAGLSGKEADLYAKFRTIVPTEQQHIDAVQAHMKTNNLHRNFVTAGLNRVTRALSDTQFAKDHPNIGGAVDVLLKNQIAPFTSFLGGAAHRALTDKNIAYNIAKLVHAGVKHDAQEVADQLANLTVNGTQALAVGYVGSSMGLITNEDANGDSYGGAYFHVGNRYIPVGILGPAATPVLLGNAYHQANQKGGDPATVLGNTFSGAVINTAKSVGVSGVFGGDNNLQTLVSSLSSENSTGLDPVVKYASGVARQYVNPALFGDANALANNKLDPANGTFGLNPNATGVAAQVNATKEDGTKDTVQTELNRTAAGIPGLSQTLARDTTGKPATDEIDRFLKSNRETGDMTSKREATKTLADTKAQLTKDKVPLTSDDITQALKDGDYENAVKGLQYQIAEDQASDKPSESKQAGLKDKIAVATLNSQGVPTDDDGIKARVESGDFDQAVKGLQYQYDKVKGDKNTPDSAKQKLQTQIEQIQLTKDNGFDAKTVALYGSTSAAEWRAMGDPDSADYDPDTYSQLTAYDKLLTANGVSKSDKSGDKLKYNESSSGSGSSKSISFTAPGVNKISFDDFAPSKAESADFATPKSAIPTIDRVPNFDSSKMKKISVTKGVAR